MIIIIIIIYRHFQILCIKINNINDFFHKFKSLNFDAIYEAKHIFRLKTNFIKKSLFVEFLYQTEFTNYHLHRFIIYAIKHSRFSVTYLCFSFSFHLSSHFILTLFQLPTVIFFMNLHSVLVSFIFLLIANLSFSLHSIFVHVFLNFFILYFPRKIFSYFSQAPLCFTGIFKNTVASVISRIVAS